LAFLTCFGSSEPSSGQFLTMYWWLYMCVCLCVYIYIYIYVMFDWINYFIISRSCLYLLSPYSHEDGDSSYLCNVGGHVPKTQPHIPRISDLDMVCILRFSKLVVEVYMGYDTVSLDNQFPTFWRKIIFLEISGTNYAVMQHHVQGE